MAKTDDLKVLSRTANEGLETRKREKIFDRDIVALDGKAICVKVR